MSSSDLPVSKKKKKVTTMSLKNEVAVVIFISK